MADLDTNRFKDDSSRKAMGLIYYQRSGPTPISMVERFPPKLNLTARMRARFASLAWSLALWTGSFIIC